MKTISPGLSDSIASVLADPRPCPHCDSSSHIAGGLCVGCLLEAGLDPDDEPFFRGTTEFFGVSRVVGRINAQAPLPHLGAQFDLVTAHRVCFHRIARREDGEWLEWTGADWKFFINDVRTRLLKPDGRLLLEFNRRADGSSFFTPELRAFFESQGARIVRWKALLAQNPNQRPRFKQS